MMEDRTILNGLLPSSMEVAAVMDDICNAFKCATCGNTHAVYAWKISANAKAAVRRKLDILPSVLRKGYVEVLPKEHQETIKITSLNPGNLGAILFGKLGGNEFCKEFKYLTCANLSPMV